MLPLHLLCLVPTPRTCPKSPYPSPSLQRAPPAPMQSHQGHHGGQILPVLGLPPAGLGSGNHTGGSYRPHILLISPAPASPRYHPVRPQHLLLQPIKPRGSRLQLCKHTAPLVGLGTRPPASRDTDQLSHPASTRSRACLGPCTQQLEEPRPLLGARRPSKPASKHQNDPSPEFWPLHQRGLPPQSAPGAFCSP